MFRSPLGAGVSSGGATSKGIEAADRASAVDQGRALAPPGARVLAPLGAAPPISWRCPGVRLWPVKEGIMTHMSSTTRAVGT